jgi:hypothetical protein
MFDVNLRDEVSGSILYVVSRDPRVRAGAIVGSLALTSGDRFSDVDLSFAIRDGIDLRSVLNDWTKLLTVSNEIDVLFDLVSGPSIYRVLLFPGALQVDVSVTPASFFGRRGESFRLLFGDESATSSDSTRRSENDMAGYAVHHALHGRTSIERGRWIQAAYWISELRNEALHIAMSRTGVEPSHARGAHLLPVGLTAEVEKTFPASLDEAELRRALAESIALLRRITQDTDLLTTRVLAQLDELAYGVIG